MLHFGSSEVKWYAEDAFGLHSKREAVPIVLFWFNHKFIALIPAAVVLPEDTKITTIMKKSRLQKGSYEDVF